MIHVGARLGMITARIYDRLAIAAAGGQPVRSEFAMRLWDQCAARGVVQDNLVQINLGERLLLQIGVR